MIHTIEHMSTPQDFATSITNFTTDIGSFKQSITDSLTVGNAMYGPYGHSDVTSEVSERTKELTKKKDELRETIKEQEAIIHRSERDFIDVRDTLPETIPTTRFHFLEDYTLVFLLITYFFMIAIALHTYVFYSSEPWMNALIRGSFYSIILTLLSGMILYYIC